jgi:hypothetical protein
VADYLTRLGERALRGTDAPVVEPRLPSRYEEAAPDEEPEPMADELVPDAERAVRRTEVPVGEAAAPVRAAPPRTVAAPSTAVAGEGARGSGVAGRVAGDAAGRVSVGDASRADRAPVPGPVRALDDVVRRLTTDGEPARGEVVPAPDALPAPEPEPALAPVVRVTIGRIEVRAATAPAATPSPPAPQAAHAAPSPAGPRPDPGARLSAYLRGERAPR